MKSRSSVVLGILATAALLLGCERSQPSPRASAAPADALPATLFVAAEPSGAKGVQEAKASAAKGDKVIIRGRVGGGQDPFISDRAVLTIVDLGVKSCADMGEDHCPTPWDYCCEAPESLVANSATIQVTGPDGRPLRAGLKGVAGLQPLAEVAILGTLVQRDDGGSFVVNADGIWVKPSGG